MPLNVATIYSTLGNPNSLIPLAVKDVSATTGMTAGSFVTGKEEGVDRLIDEVGTQIIWLGGIPISKAIYNALVFKTAKFDHKFDPRNLKDKDIFEKIKQYAPDEKIKNELEKISNKEKLFKNLVSTRFVVSTALTIASYLFLTKFKQKYTEKKIRQNLINEYNKQQEQQKNKENNNDLLPDNTTNPNFKGIGPMVEKFAFSPVRNMWILDGAITTARLADSRTPQEFVGYSIKEFATLFFLYYAGGKIQDLMVKNAKVKHNKTIGLDARAIENDSLKKAFENGSIQKSLEEFKAANTSKANLYEFLHKNPDNLIVQVAKLSDVIKLYNKTEKIDVRKYIDLDEIESINKNITELYNEYKGAIKDGHSSEEFFNGVKKLKRKSIRANIGASIFALGIITPAIMLAKRIVGKDDTEFQTKKEIRQQLINEGLIA